VLAAEPFRSETMSLVVFAAVLAVLALAEVVLFVYLAYLLLEWGVEAVRERWWCCRSRWGRTPASLSSDLRRLSALGNVGRFGLQPPMRGAARGADDPQHPQRLGPAAWEGEADGAPQLGPVRMDVTGPAMTRERRPGAPLPAGRSRKATRKAVIPAPRRRHRSAATVSTARIEVGPRTEPPVHTHPVGQG
jgi:hypothetical protein